MAVVRRILWEYARHHVALVAVSVLFVFLVPFNEICLPQLYGPRPSFF